MENRNLNKQIISMLVYNNPGIIMRISGLFTRRGFNIETIGVGKTKKNGMVRLTITTLVDDHAFDQIQKQLYKIIDVVKVSPIDAINSVKKEMAMIKIKFNDSTRDKLIQTISVFKGKIVDTSLDGLIVELTGTVEKIESFIDMIDCNNVIEIARSGIVAINRWKKKENKNGKNLL
jgi:acetolactate synthase-1/3 small subunit